jgi:4-hydroxy-tetrahydrodipicolinate reductase
VIRVGVFGAAGRMGAVTCAAVSAADDLELVAAADPVAAGRLLGEVAGMAGADLVGPPALIEVHADGEGFAPGGVEVAVDFTVADAARQNLAWCAEHGVHAVCGTTGLSDEDRGEIGRLFAASAGNCVIAPNFSIGAALMMRCAELCAPYLEGVEIIEFHHDEKKDAPSGTALETARRIEAARTGQDCSPAPFRRDPTERITLEHARGGVTAGGVRVHSVRLPGFVAHQEVIFGSSGETLTVRHDSTDRISFMAGVLLAIRRVGDLPGLTVGLERLIGL